MMQRNQTRARVFPRVGAMPIFLLSAGVLITACGGSSSSTSTGSTETLDVRLAFAAQAGDGQPLDGCGSLSGLGTTSSTADLADFAFYVHDIELIDQSGNRYPLALDGDSPWQWDHVAMLDFQDHGDFCKGEAKPTNHVVAGQIEGVSEGTRMTGVAFKVGVPFEYNHWDASQAPAPLNRPGMFWRWQTGYKFMRLDVEPAGGVERPDPENPGQTTIATRWNLHLGSTGCEGDPATGEPHDCSARNVVDVELSGHDVLEETIVLDYGALIAGNDLSRDEGGPVGCMSGTNDPECGAIFSRLGLDWDAQGAQGPQSVFFLR